MSSTGMPTVAGILMVMSLFFLSDYQGTGISRNRGSMSRSSFAAGETMSRETPLWHVLCGGRDKADREAPSVSEDSEMFR